MEIGTFLAGFIVGAALTVLMFLIAHMYYETKSNYPNKPGVINKQKMLNAMNQRMNALSIYLKNDYGSNLTGYHEAHREVRYWRDCITRGVFDEEGNQMAQLSLDIKNTGIFKDMVGIIKDIAKDERVPAELREEIMSKVDFIVESRC